MKALVHGTRVCEVAADEFPVAHPLQWFDCDESVTPQHTFDGVRFVPPQPSAFHEWDGAAWAVPTERATAVHNAGVDAQIRAIESRELLPRAAREAILVGIAKDYMRDNSVTFQAAVVALTTVGSPGYNAGFTKLYALDNQIKALRAQRLP